MFDILGKWLKGEPFDALARALFDLGGQFDYVSDAQLAALAARAGRYKAVVVPPCRYCAPETIDALTTLAESGVSIIMVGALPEDVPGNARLDERRQKLAAAKSRLAAVAKTADAADVADALEAAGVRLERDAARHGLQLTRRRTDDATEYFVANRTRKPLDAMIAFNCPQGEIVFRDPMTGVVGEAPQTSERSVRVQLFPGQSLLVRALPSRGDSDGAPWRYLDRASEPIAISGPWSVEFVDPVLPGRATASVLGSWTDLPLVGADAYAGTARYTAIFDAPGSPADEWLIDFGQVADSASVTVNGQSVGTLIGSPWHVVVSDLKATGNELWVEVTNVAANRIRAMDRKNIPWRKFKDINFVDIQYKRFDASHWPVRPAGLLGPVTLSRLKR
jgi:hypothetical protein